MSYAIIIIYRNFILYKYSGTKDGMRIMFRFVGRKTTELSLELMKKYKKEMDEYGFQTPEEYEEVTNAINELESDIGQFDIVKELESLEPALWKLKEEMEEGLQETISEFYDECYSTDNPTDVKLLVTMLDTAKKARDEYFNVTEDRR